MARESDTSSRPTGFEPESAGASEASLARFNAFYDDAFPRVYRYAQRRMRDEASAQALCRLVFVRIVTSLGGLEVVEHRVQHDEATFAYWLFCLTRRTADMLEAQLAEHPEPISAVALGEGLEDPALEFLRSAEAERLARRSRESGER